MAQGNLLSIKNSSLNTLVISRANDVLAADLEGEAVLLDINENAYIGMNAIGNSIWKLLEKPITFSDLCKKLMEQYEVTEETCKYDTISFLEKLSESTLINVDEGSNA